MTSGKSNSRCAIVVDLGGTHLRAAVVDHDGHIHCQTKQSTPRSSNPANIVRAIVEAVSECESKTQKAVDSICVAVPGTVDVARGSAIKITNLPELNGFALASELERELKRPALIENDANAAAVGEMWRGAARGTRTMVCITLGTGVGSGIILNGELWRGVNNAAAEFGHTAVEPNGGVKCRCGATGCLEVYASATAIVRMARESAQRKVSENLTAEGVYDAALAGDELSLEVFRRMGSYLGIGLANLVNIINPEMFVIGGGVSRAWDLFAEHMRREVIQRAFDDSAGDVEIKRAECGDDAGLLGAAQMAFKRRNVLG